MEKSIPWMEKYRPEGLEDLILDLQIKKQIDVYIANTTKNTNMHLIITGFPGIGKTSTVKCIAKKILGDNIANGYLELNAGDDRGVKSISAKIPEFCKKLVNFSEPKIILLDEADRLTAKCQYDINTMIKQFGKETKFIFTCNSSGEIVEDIQSVCTIINFKTLTDEQIANCLEKICANEKIKFNRSGIEMICYISAGDMRKAINNLQLVAYTYRNVSKQYVLKICKLPDPEDIKKIITACLEKDLNTANSELEGVIQEGYYYSDIVTAFIYVLTAKTLLGNEIEEQLKIDLINIIQQTRIAISVGTRSKLQLCAMICRLIGRVM